MTEDLQKIIERNARVEAEKAWETSGTRRTFIAIVTYIIAATYMEVMGLGPALLGACVPTGGYLLSTFSLPPLKKYWMANCYKKNGE